MSPCLNDHQNRLPVPSNLDLSQEINLITLCQAEREKFSLGARWGVVYIMVPK